MWIKMPPLEFLSFRNKLHPFEFMIFYMLSVQIKTINELVLQTSKWIFLLVQKFISLSGVIMRFENNLLIKPKYRGFSCDVISCQFCKSSYLRPTCWFPFAWTGIAKYNKMSCYFSFSSYHNTKLRPSDNNSKTHTRLKFQILLL